MSDAIKILIGKGENQVHLLGKLANRHGLIAGATGTGKTVTLQVLAEGFSRIGVPVFMADVKGDLSGISQAGSPHPKVDERVEKIGITDFEFSDNPTVFWDLEGKKGHPVRATVSDMGPNLLSRLMDLNETQEGILNIAFRFADDEGMLMLDLKDLQSTLKFLGENAKEFRDEYGNITSASVGAIQRRLLVLEEEGADDFFGEPSLELWDLIRTAHTGKGLINILNAQNLIMNPKLYATFLLWLLSELFEELPEVGDQEKPKFVFFFDEAHLLFNDAPKALVEKVEAVVKLIRSKGVGIYFITQSPSDIPDGVLGQLGNRVQHALRAFTPKDQKAVRVVAETMRPNPAINTKEVIGELGVGEALVSVLDADGVPTMVDRVLISPPVSRIGPATESEQSKVMSNSPHSGRYDKAVDRESAFELLEERVIKQAAAAQAKIDEEEAAKIAAKEEKARERAAKPKGRGRQTLAEAATKTFVRSISSRLATQVVRGILGGFMRR